MILKPQITKFLIKLNLGQYSISPSVKEATARKQTERVLVLKKNAILRLNPGKRGILHSPSIYAHISSRSIYDCLYPKAQ